MISNGIFQRPRRDVLGMLGYGGAEILGKESVKLKEKESQMKDFCKQTGRSADTARTQVSAVYDGNGNLVSFNRSVSGKAVWANKKAKQGGNKTCYLEKHLN